MSRDCWSVLGIARTDDLREVRRAYAQALKAIDVDNDPASFIALREAFDQANRRIAWGDTEDEDEWGWLEVEHLPAPEPVRPKQVEFPPAGSPDGLERLAFLLYAEPAAGRDQIEAAVQAVVNDPRMAQVDVALDVEARLAVLLAETIPRSDPGLVAAINAFTWQREDKLWQRPYAVSQIMQRYRDCFFRAEIAKAGHPSNRAYRRLIAPPPERKSVLHAWGHRQMRSLLARIRSDHPTVELELNADSVAWWEARSAGLSETTRDWVIGTLLKGVGAFVGACLWPADRFWGAIGGLWSVVGLMLLLGLAVRLIGLVREIAEATDRRAMVLDLAWMCGLPILVLLAVVLPTGYWAASLVGVPALMLGCVCAARRPGTDRYSGGPAWLYPALAIGWWLGCLVLLPPAEWVQCTAPLATSGWVVWTRIGQIDEYLRKVPALIRLALIVSLVAAGISLAIALNGATGPFAPLMSLWLLAVFVLSDQVPVIRLTEIPWLMRFFFGYQVVLFASHSDRGPAIPASILVIIGVLRLWRQGRALWLSRLTSWP